MREIKAHGLDRDNRRLLASLDKAAQKHPLIIDDRGVLRFKPDPFVRYVVEHFPHVGTNLIVALQEEKHGVVTPEMYLKFERDSGYSLSGYASDIFGGPVRPILLGLLRKEKKTKKKQ